MDSENVAPTLVMDAETLRTHAQRIFEGLCQAGGLIGLELQREGVPNEVIAIASQIAHNVIVARTEIILDRMELGPEIVLNAEAIDEASEALALFSAEVLEEKLSIKVRA